MDASLGTGHTQLAAFLLLLAMIAVVHPQDTSYRVSKSLNDNDGFDIKLTCQNHLGISVTNAEFYRNGADSNTDVCLNETIYSTSSDGSSINLRSSSECDGYYMCGVPSSNNYILSGPLAVYTEPVETGNGEQMIQIEEGQSTTLQCKISSSPINQYETKWIRLVEADDKAIKTITTGDNSLHLENVTLSKHQGAYYCQVSTNLPKNGIFVTSLTNGNTKLQIFEKFDPPRFIRNLTYSGVNSNEQAIFNTLAADNVHYPVSYRWEINGTVVPDSTNEELSMDIGYGRTKVRVTIWNTNYNDEEYSKSQTLYVNRESQQPFDDGVMEEASEKVNLSVDEFVGIIIGVLAIAILLVGIIVAVVFLVKHVHVRRQGPEPKPEVARPEPNPEVACPEPKPKVAVDDGTATQHETRTEQLIELLDCCKNLAHRQILNGVTADKLILTFVVGFVEGIPNSCKLDKNKMKELLVFIRSSVEKLPDETRSRSVQTDNAGPEQDSIVPDCRREKGEEEILETKQQETDIRNLKNTILQKVDQALSLACMNE